MKRRVGHLLALLALVAACKTKLAPLEVRDTSMGLLFTWIDARGDYHVELSPKDVPEVGRDVVRVVDPARDEGSHDAAVFLVDLRTRSSGGTYPLRMAPLAEFEKLATERRTQARSRRTTDATPQASVPAQPQANAPGQGSATAAPLITIYGASWCGPCHDAERYLRKRGIAYVMKDVEVDANAASEMQRKLRAIGRGAGSIPVIDVGGRILVGFSEMVLEEALGKAM